MKQTRLVVPERVRWAVEHDIDPRTLVERVHAVVLTGGSAYGLAAASGVADALGAAGRGFRVGPGSITHLHEDDYFHNRTLMSLGDTTHLRRS